MKTRTNHCTQVDQLLFLGNSCDRLIRSTIGGGEVKMMVANGITVPLRRLLMLLNELIVFGSMNSISDSFAKF